MPNAVLPQDILEPDLLRLDRLSRHRAGRPAVQDLSLTLKRGQVLGLLGVNGAGKSTTLSMIAGALRPDSGTIALNGEDFLEHPERARRLIGWLPERAPQWPELTVGEHLDTHGRLRGLNGVALKQAREAIVERLELGPLQRRLAGVLSQGQRQRLGLACALVHKPALLVLDEPANALDPIQVAALRTLIREQVSAGTTVILSTHLLAEVTAVCDRVAILHEGRLHHDGPITDGDHKALEQTFFDIAMRGGDSTPSADRSRAA
ncbi:ABC transporter ATP-binding protein [Dyella tabacisoli]